MRPGDGAIEALHRAAGFDAEVIRVLDVIDRFGRRALIRQLLLRDDRLDAAKRAAAARRGKRLGDDRLRLLGVLGPGALRRPAHSRRLLICGAARAAGETRPAGAACRATSTGRAAAAGRRARATAFEVGRGEIEL